MKKIEQLNSKKLSVRYLREQRKNASLSNDSNQPKQKNSQIFGNEVIDLPVHVNLYSGDNESCYDFFDDLRELLETNPKFIYLSFRETEVLKAMPLLMIYSIIDQARESKGGQFRIGIIWSKKSKRVNSIIRASGGFKRATLREEMMEGSESMPVIMGDNSRANDLSDTIVNYILDDKYYAEASAEKEQQISSAIQETVDNVGRHAYPNVKKHEDKKWWICCDRVGDNLFIVIYDAGIGIPSSLSENNAVLLTRVNLLYPEQSEEAVRESIEEDSAARKLKALLRVQLLRKRLSDGQLIRAAMHVDITSTDLNKHGQGSKSIKGLITDDENSFLLMFSNYGFYKYNRRIEDNENSVDNSAYRIPGTLIQWSI